MAVTRPGERGVLLLLSTVTRVCTALSVTLPATADGRHGISNAPPSVPREVLWVHAHSVPISVPPGHLVSLLCAWFIPSLGCAAFSVMSAQCELGVGVVEEHRRCHTSVAAPVAGGGSWGQEMGQLGRTSVFVFSCVVTPVWRSPRLVRSAHLSPALSGAIAVEVQLWREHVGDPGE